MTNIKKIKTNEKETEREIEKQKEETNENGKGKEQRESMFMECPWSVLGLLLDGP